MGGGVVHGETVRWRMSGGPSIGGVYGMFGLYVCMHRFGYIIIFVPAWGAPRSSLTSLGQYNPSWLSWVHILILRACG